MNVGIEGNQILVILRCLVPWLMHIFQMVSGQSWSNRLQFVGYNTQSKGYRLLDEKTSNVVIRRDIIFNERDFGHKVDEVQQHRSMEFDSNSEGDVISRDVEPELEGWKNANAILKGRDVHQFILSMQIQL